MKKIVLIEDNEDVRENIAEILELSSYKVFPASNGKEGVKQVQENLPDLILCDIMMPELDGYGVLKILSNNPKTANIPFVFLTAKSEKGDFRKGMDLGADDYLVKPFEDIQLLNAVELRLHKVKNGTSDLPLEDYESFYSKEKAEIAINQLFNKANPEFIDRKDMLFACGAKPRFIYKIVEGQFKTYEINNDGKELITGLYADGDLIGLADIFDAKHYNECARSITKTKFVKVMRSDLLKLIYENRDVAMYFYRKLAFSVNIRKFRLINLAYNSVRQRTADSILWIDDIFNKKHQYPFKFSFSREDLACLVGTAKESVIRQLASLKEDKLIDTNSSEITLIDRKSLESIR